MLNKLRIIFAGTSNFSAKHLYVLIKNTEHEIVGIFTKPDHISRSNNKSNLNSVKQIAKLYNIPIFQTSFIKEDHIKLVSKLNSDIMIVVSYGIILPKVVLDLPKLGCINVHGSLLPRWRGAAPIQRALCAGDNITGVTIIYMDEGIDTGSIIHRSVCNIKPNDTYLSLEERLAKIGSKALLTTINNLASGNVNAEIQDNRVATYAKKINKKEARLNWNLPAIQLNRYIRAFNPWPVSYFILNKKIIKVWDSSIDLETSSKEEPGTILSVNKYGISIATIEGVLILKKIQLENRKSVTIKEFLNSKKMFFAVGKVLD